MNRHKRIRNSGRGRTGGLIGGILLVIGLTYFLLNSPLITDVIAPFVYASLLTILSAINSLPQILVWLIFMLIVIQLLTTGLMRFANVMRHKHRSRPRDKHERVLSPVKKYQRWLDRSNQGVYFRWRIVERLIQITQDVKGQGGTRSRPQIEREIHENVYNLPEHVSQFLSAGMDARNATETAVNRIQSILDNRPVDHSQLAATLDYLESELGIRNAFDGASSTVENTL